MNRSVFFNYVRKAPFGNGISQNQVNGLTFLLDYKDKNYPSLSDEKFAYVLATVFHETAATMKPVVEYGGEKYLKSKPYYPFYGRGYVQLTWDYNYAKYGIKNNPEKALDPSTAAKILFDGMEKGVFTGKKLSDYFNDKKNDAVNARRIINGSDKASLISGYWKNFLDSLKAANEAKNEEENQTVEETKAVEIQKIAEVAPIYKDPLALATAAGTGISSTSALVNAINNPFALVAFALSLIVGGLALYFIVLKRKDKRV